MFPFHGGKTRDPGNEAVSNVSPRCRLRWTGFKYYAIRPLRGLSIRKFFVSLGTTYIVLSFSVHIIGFYLDGTGVALVFIESTRFNSNQWRPGSNLASGDLSELSLFMVLLYFNGHCLTASNQIDARE